MDQHLPARQHGNHGICEHKQSHSIVWNNLARLKPTINIYQIPKEKLAIAIGSSDFPLKLNAAELPSEMLNHVSSRIQEAAQKLQHKPGSSCPKLGAQKTRQIPETYPHGQLGGTDWSLKHMCMIHSRTDARTHSRTHPLSHSLTSFTHSLNDSLTHLPTPLTHSLPLSLARSLTHSLTYSLTHSLTHPLTHSLTNQKTNKSRISGNAQKLQHRKCEVRQIGGNCAKRLNKIRIE